MAKQKKNKGEEEVLVDVTQTLSGAEKFFEENRKSITVIFVALFVIVGGYFAYLYLYQQPREAEAQQEIFWAQQYFEQDSLNLALRGDGEHYGFLDIADEYSGTKAGNLANYYAGVCYLNQGDYEKAIALLDEFDSNDPILSVIAEGAIGDAFLELEQPKEALEYYKRAVSGESNNFIVPFYLMKAGMLAESNGDHKAALNFYQRIQHDFPDSQEATNIEKYIARVEAKNRA
jgi:tetratricopeptide (TPR) repeat protein